MKNAEWIIKNGYKFADFQCQAKDSCKTYDILMDGKIVGKVRAVNYFWSFREWLDMEHKEPILDDAEREYLSAVIKPFRDRVKYIKKVFVDHLYGDADYYIFIRFNSGSDDMDFPVFHEDTMYNGMKIGKAYSLEDLGL